jgi:hypothetical protein
MQQTFVAGDPRINPDNSVKVLFEVCGCYLDSSRKPDLLDRNGRATRMCEC